MRLSFERVAALCGLAAPLAFLVLYVVAMAGDPEYVFFRNYLSDLGVGAAAWAFNSAVIIAGALSIPFVLLSLRPALGGGITAGLAVAFTSIASVFLILVGVFTEDAGDTHYLVSLGFFMSFQVALLFHSWTLHLSHALGDRVTWFTKAVFTLGLALMALGFDPRTETVAVLSLVTWDIVVAATILTRGTPAPID